MNINLIGNFCIFTSLLLSGVGIGLALLKQQEWVRRIAYFNFFLMTVAGVGMMFALLTNDFSVSYVAQVGAIETPRFFAAISLWSSLEGSILLWGLVLSGYTALCSFRYRNSFQELMPSVHIVLFAIGIFFYLVLAFPANPFQTVFPIPENGPGPNPLLQNHWLMGVHPPMLYLGYVGMSVPFAFALASLITGRLDSGWVTITKRWFLAAWMFLSAAIILGAWWSYAVLGWGGYWAWDPVENASFMPWLVGSAYLHSIMVEEKRQMLRIWNLVLIVVTFLLTLLGTFLTRSGILESVHSFTESAIGEYFLGAISLALCVAVGLLIWRGPKLKSVGRLEQPFCRESAFLVASLLFVSFCFVVLLGTLYPLIVEAVRGIKISVGAPFFNQMTTPLALLLILWMGVGVLLPPEGANPRDLFRRLRWPTFLSLIIAGVFWFFGVKNVLVCLTVFFSFLALWAMGFEMAAVFFQHHCLFRRNPRRYGGFVVHAGIVVILLGIAFSSNFQGDRQINLKVGDDFQIGPYQVKLVHIHAEHKPQRFELIADTEILKEGKTIGLLQPKLNFYPNSREPVSSPAIRSTLLGDVYLTLMAFEHGTLEATFRAMVRPAVSWIWLGGGILVLGVWISLAIKKREK